MVQVYRPGKSHGRGRKRNSSAAGKSKQEGRRVELVVDSLDHEARGVVRGNPVTFVPGALPGERCNVRLTGQRRGVQQGELIEVLEASGQRAAPFCRHYSQCGGCQTQHIQHPWFIAEKQQALTFLINKFIGKKNDALPWQTPITDRQTGYRRKARLAVDARDKKAMKLGFRDARNEIFSVAECQVLTEPLQTLIHPLQQLIARLKTVKKLGHISLFDGADSLVADDDGAQKCLAQVIFRYTEKPEAHDVALFQEFELAQQCRVIFHLDHNQFLNLNGENENLSYWLAVNEGTIKIELSGNDFVQINANVNNKMVQQALDWLALSQEDRVLDLFCGVGNFSLPIAQQCQWVTGFEGVSEMVQMAQYNAQQNNIHNIKFVSGDLTQEATLAKFSADNCNKVLLDPARAGALEAVAMLERLQPEVIVYVSCNPATFGRDIACLLSENYQLKKLSLIDMFPGTAHSELMAMFSRV